MNIFCLKTFQSNIYVVLLEKEYVGFINVDFLIETYFEYHDIYNISSKILKSIDFNGMNTHPQIILKLCVLINVALYIQIIIIFFPFLSYIDGQYSREQTGKHWMERGKRYRQRSTRWESRVAPITASLQRRTNHEAIGADLRFHFFFLSFQFT